MLVIPAHTKLATNGIVRISLAGRSGLIKPIFAGYIVADKLVGKESRCQKRQRGGFRMGIGEIQGSEPGLEAILFLSVEIHLELFGICGSSKIRLAVGRLEFIAVYGYVAQK